MRSPRNWSIIAAGLLLLALALVVIYTSTRAFFSPLAIVVVAAIGLAALLIQLRLQRQWSNAVQAPLWMNVLGLIFALAAVLADFLHAPMNILLFSALGAVICFAISGLWVLRGMRKTRG